MSVISTSVGLISGLNTGDIIDALISAQRAGAARLESRKKNFEAAQLGYKTLEATLLSVKTSADALGKAETFGKLTVTSSDDKALTATARGNAVAGTTTFEPLRRAAAHTLKSRGYSGPTQAVGAGTVTIARGGDVNAETSLSLLNGGTGVRLGTIRVTDRAGVSADIDLSTARTAADVVAAINAGNAGVRAEAQGDKFVLTDRSGGTGNLVVRDLGSGQTAADLGIVGSVAGGTLTGASVFSVSGTFALSQIDDGNAPKFSSTGADLRVTLTDGTHFDVELSTATTVQGVLDAINGHTDNAGKVVASLANGKIVLQDTVGGAGNVGVSDLAGAKVARSLGLDSAGMGGTLTGKTLHGGMNTSLLRNLRGGQGVTQLGQISLTDRAGRTATIDLSNATSLGDVIGAVNAAQTAGGLDLSIEAAVDDSGLGITLRDTSGATASNLIVADVGGGTLAADLNIDVDGAVTSVRSGHLGRRYVSESTSLSTYGPGGKAVGLGNFQITDSAGTVSTISVSGQTTTIGDVIDRINAASVAVTAKLNDTGDGIVLIDEAAGAGNLTVADLGTATAAKDLKLVGTGTAGTDGKQRIDGRQSVLVTLDGDDTLNDLESKLKAANAGLTATIFNDGSAANPSRLLVTGTKTGTANRLRIDDGGIGLGLSTVVAAQDALLRVGEDAATGLLMASDTNSFKNVPGGLDVDLLKAGGGPVSVSVAADPAGVVSAVKQLVATYNQFVDTTATLTKFDLAANQRGILQGDATVLRMRDKLTTVLAGRHGTDDEVRTLAGLGLTFGETGKLVLDETRLTDTLDEDPDAVKAFFSDKTAGFGKKMKAALDSLTDPITGTFKLQDNALTDSIERLERRVADIDVQLVAKRELLVRQFAKMEEALASMQTQQNTLSQFMLQQQANRG